MIALDQIVSPLSVDVPDAVEMRVVTMIDLTDDTAIRLRFVSYDCHRSVQAHTLDRFVQSKRCQAFLSKFHGMSSSMRDAGWPAAMASSVALR